MPNRSTSPTKCKPCRWWLGPPRPHHLFNLQPPYVTAKITPKEIFEREPKADSSYPGKLRKHNDTTLWNTESRSILMRLRLCARTRQHNGRIREGRLEDKWHHGFSHTLRIKIGGVSLPSHRHRPTWISAIWGTDLKGNFQESRSYFPYLGWGVVLIPPLGTLRRRRDSGDRFSTTCI